MEIDAEFWVIVALIVFIGVILYIRVPRLLATALDNRIRKIEADLDEAARVILSRQMTEKGDDLVTQAIQDVAAKLH
jgi:F0F1-type ATP synthase membrane subunit b/b'